MEIIRPSARRGTFRAAVFDFDGTLSLLREGWARVMAELGRDRLFEQHLIREPEHDLLAFLENEMQLLSGKPSLVQMSRLADEVTARGGTAGEPTAYLKEFHRRLFAAVGDRIAGVAAGDVPPDRWTVPGSFELLTELRNRGVVLVLASGTDRPSVVRELGLLKLSEFFCERVHAPADVGAKFSKADVFAAVAAEYGPPIGFGDGAAETVEVKRVGGAAVGLATGETPGVNPTKRRLLVELGADVILADYRPTDVVADMVALAPVR